jgi:hypothetical protein
MSRSLLTRHSIRARAILGLLLCSMTGSSIYANETVKQSTLPNGDTKFRIDQPVVNSPQNQPHPNIKFLPGDRITIVAGGCVQTGGIGPTWKRYVDPTGDAETKYFGRFHIPGATSGFVRFARAGSTLFIPKTFHPPPGGIFLTLRYEDDGYGDNGYSGHEGDEGTDGQCRQGINLDGGDAWIEITIHHNADQILSGAPYDLLATEYDLNGLPLNPRWAPQYDPQPPPYFPSVSGSGRGVCNMPWQEPCTSQSPIIVDLPSDFDILHPINGISCGVGGLLGPGNGHHINWGVVTYQGAVSWSKRAFFDDDYNFNLASDDHAAYTTQNASAMHTEFDSDETIDNFNAPWWKTFRDAVDQSIDASGVLTECQSGRISCDAAKISALQATIDRPKMLVTPNGKPAETIEVGVIGLDCAHNCGSEIHPVLAMAVHVQDNPADDVWAVFARNSGDEGFCSHDSILAPELTTIYLTLPWRAEALNTPTVTPQTVWEKSAVGGGDQIHVTTFPLVTGMRPSGFVLKIDLGDVNNAPIINGEIHLQWPVSPGSASTAARSHVGAMPGLLHATAVDGRPAIIATFETSEAGLEPEERFEKLFSGLPAPSKRKIELLKTENPPIFHWTSLRPVSLSVPPAGFTARLARRAPSAERAGVGRIRVAPNARKKQFYERLGPLLREANAAAPPS